MYFEGEIKLSKEWGIVANVQADKALRIGAKVTILESHGDASQVKVRGCSKSGRVIEKYIPFKRLKNFRAAWIPEKLRDEIHHWHKFETKDKAAQYASGLNKLWKDVRFYSRNGEMLKDGISESTAFKRSLDED